VQAVKTVAILAVYGMTLWPMRDCDQAEIAVEGRNQISQVRLQ
jgi:hypothetical protein